MNKHYSHDEDDDVDAHVGNGAAWFVWYAVAAVAVLALLVGSCVAQAQTTTPTLTFSAEVTRGVESVAPKLTWSTTPAATTCTASGDWTGTKAASGTETLPAITSNKTYGLACTWPGDDKATLTWVPPTTYTSGAPLTIAKYRIIFGTNQADVDRTFATPAPVGVTVRDHNFPTSTTATVTGIATPGTYFFCLRVLDAAGTPSDCGKNAAGNMVSKVITGSASQSRSVAVAIDPKPNAAQNVEAQ